MCGACKSDNETLRLCFLIFWRAHSIYDIDNPSCITCEM